MVRYPGCISFSRSLELLHIRDIPGAYGVDTEEYACEMCWTAAQREGWLMELVAAQTEIEKELGDNFICPREICDEVHLAADEIKLDHPVYALGRWAYTDWAEVDVVYDPVTDGDFESATKGTVEICDTELTIDGTLYDINNIEFDWPETIAECYSGLQEVPAPCELGHFDASVACPGGGYAFNWPFYQLLSPLLPALPMGPDSAPDCADYNEDNYAATLRFRFRYVDDSDPVTMVGKCSCSNGCDVNGVTATIIDANEGVICLDGTVCGRNSRVKVDYISSYRCVSTPDPALEKAVVVLAMVFADGSIAKPCECDNTWLDSWTMIDESSRGAFPSQLRYGNTKGGMFAMRTINRFLGADAKKTARTVPIISRGKFKTYLSRFM